MENYTQIRVLGKGSFGAAWLIQRNADRVQFVAKEIRLAGLKPAERESAKNEIDVLRALNHPNITKYVDHFEHRGSLFIVMEYANGGDLYIKIKERKGKLFSEKELLHYFSQLCLALGYLHEHRILHRDLKTQNVFLTKDGIVKLGDFGISTVLRNTYELKRTVCGTPYYFSPELCLSKPYNNKSDVWALGCILYEMTTLNHAFDGTNMKALVQKILKGAFPPIHPSYSSDLSKLISAMLQIEPHRRPNVSQIIDLPFIRDALMNLQHEVQLAKERRQSVVPEEERRRIQRAAVSRREEYQKREQENAERLAEVHRQQRAVLDQQQQRQRQLAERQREQERQQEVQMQARKRELEQRVREQRRLEEQRRAKTDSAEQQRREDEWDRNMRAQAEEDKRKREAERERRAAATAAATEAYRERQRQAAANKQRAMADMGVESPQQEPRQASPSTPPRHRHHHTPNAKNKDGAADTRNGTKAKVQPLSQPPDQPPPPRLPPSPHHYSSKTMTTEQLGDALAGAYWQMRREAERNKRRAMGLDVSDDSVDPSCDNSVAQDDSSPDKPSPNSHHDTTTNASVPAPPARHGDSKSNNNDHRNTKNGNGNVLDAIAAIDTDGEEGFRAFINGDAVIEEEAAEVWTSRRQVDYGALDTYITQALTMSTRCAASPSPEADFDDTAFQDGADPTKFMLDGKTFQLPNVTAKDPLMHRIESLRMFLEEKMGDSALIECYRALNSISTDADERVQKVSEALPADKRRFIPLVMQLIVCEDAFNRQRPANR